MGIDSIFGDANLTLKIFFLRHGETEYSITGGYCGDLDAELTEAGRQMASEFAVAHEQESFQAIYCSPMKRTVATAKPLADAKSLSLNLRNGLKEISYGKWEAKTNEYVKEHYLQDFENWRAEPAWNRPTDGETAVEISERALPVISEIRRTHSSGNVLVVSHKATIRIILCSLLGIELGRYRDRIDAPAASLSVVKFNEHGPMLERLADRSYLSAELKARAGT